MGQAGYVRQRPPTTWARVPVILDIHEAAILLGISEVQLRKISHDMSDGKELQSGEVPAFKVGKVWSYSKTRLMQFAGEPQNGGV